MPPKDKTAQKIVKVAGKTPTAAIAEPEPIAKDKVERSPKSAAIAAAKKAAAPKKEPHVPDNKVRLPHHVIAMGRKRAEMLGITHPSSVLAGMITLADRFYGLGPCVVLTIPIADRFRSAIVRYHALSEAMRSAKSYTLSPGGFDYIQKLQPGLVDKLINAGHLKAYDKTAIAEHLAIIDAEMSDVAIALDDAAKTA